MKGVNGIELLEMIKNKKIKQGTKIYILCDWEEYNSQAFQSQSMKFYTLYGVYRQLHMFREIDGKEEDIRVVDTEDLLTKKFVIIEEQQEIDIQKIKEFDKDKARKEIFTYTGPDGKKSNLYCFSLFTESRIIPKINELVQAVKQLDKNKKDKE